MSLLKSSVLVGAFAGALTYLKSLLSFFLGLFFVTLDLKDISGYQNYSIVFREILSLGKFIPLSGKVITKGFLFNKKNNRFEHIFAEDLSEYAGIILRFPFPILYGKVNTNGTNENGTKKGVITFIRFMFNYKKFLGQLYTAFIAFKESSCTVQSENSKNRIYFNRFFVLNITGTSDSVTKSESGKNDKDLPINDADINPAFGDRYLCSSVTFSNLSCDREIPENVFDGYYLSEETKCLFNEIHRFLASKEWFLSRGVPWKMGVLLHGEPGTGKTSFIKKLAQHFGIPVVSFDLATLSNSQLLDEWNNHVVSHGPVIALFEDIDSVFDKRKNLLAGKSLLKDPLTFNCFLNVLDGVKENYGTLVVITTNKIDKLDKALAVAGDVPSRPGRIDKVLKIHKISDEGRTTIASSILKGTNLNINNLVSLGKGDTAAQFQNRCTQIALKFYWENKK